MTDALDRIQGSIVDDAIVVYYDDAMGLYYYGPVEDLKILEKLMADEDEDVSRDAYSHWCASVTHSDGHETAEEAIAASRVV